MTAVDRCKDDDGHTLVQCTGWMLYHRHDKDGCQYFTNSPTGCVECRGYDSFGLCMNTNCLVLTWLNVC